jgi:hypothetical protein
VGSLLRRVLLADSHGFGTQRLNRATPTTDDEWSGRPAENRRLQSESIQVECLQSLPLNAE